MNFGPRGTIGAAPLCWNLLPTLMTTSGFFGNVSELRLTGRRVADPQRMGLGEIGVELAHLRHRHAEEFGELRGLGGGLGLVDFVADDQERHPGLDQELGGARDLVRVRAHPHARVELLLRDDVGAHPIVVVVGMPGDVGGAERRRPRRLEGAAHGFRDHVGPARQPREFRDRLGELFLVGDLLEAVAAGAARLVGAVGVDDERRLFLPGVEDLAHGIHHADHAGLHHHGGLARGLDVARRHGGARPLVGGQHVFELRPVDQRLVELGILARRIAEHVFHAAGDELLGQGGAAGALERLHPRDRGGRTAGGGHGRRAAGRVPAPWRCLAAHKRRVSRCRRLGRSSPT